MNKLFDIGAIKLVDRERPTGDLPDLETFVPDGLYTSSAISNSPFSVEQFLPRQHGLRTRAPSRLNTHDRISIVDSILQKGIQHSE